MPHCDCGANNWQGNECGSCGAVFERIVPCDWFLDCEEISAGRVNHPTLGDVETCQTHIDWLAEDWPNPTKMVPPLAAKHGRKVRATLARLTEEEGE